MHRNVVEQEDLEESIETVIAGYQRKGAVISPAEKGIAYHESVTHLWLLCKSTVLRFIRLLLFRVPTAL